MLLRIVFIIPERFGTFPGLRDRPTFRRRDFGLEQNLDAEMKFGKPSVSCPLCREDFVRTSGLSLYLPRLPHHIPKASALRTASRMSRTRLGHHADRAEDVRRKWRSNGESSGKHADTTGSHAEATPKVSGKCRAVADINRMTRRSRG